jgi:serine/threonine protein kinase
MKNRPKALRICLDAARALSLMHARGFVHKDIQPKNILYLRGHGKITDFDTLSRVGSPFTPAGTPAYFPPENAPETQTATNDPSQDMFAFGVMLAEVLDPDIGAELHSICYRAVSASELATVTQDAPQAVPLAVTQAAAPRAAVEKQQEEGEIEDIEDILEEEEGVVAEEEAVEDEEVVEEKEEGEAGAAEAGAVSEEDKKVEETEEEKKLREEREEVDKETGPEPTRWRLYFVQQDLRGASPLLDLAADLISFNPKERPTAEQTATRLAEALGEQ